MPDVSGGLRTVVVAPDELLRRGNETTSRRESSCSCLLPTHSNPIRGKPLHVKAASAGRLNVPQINRVDNGTLITFPSFSQNLCPSFMGCFVLSDANIQFDCRLWTNWKERTASF